MKVSQPVNIDSIPKWFLFVPCPDSLDIIDPCENKSEIGLEDRQRYAADTYKYLETQSLNVRTCGRTCSIVNIAERGQPSQRERMCFGNFRRDYQFRCRQSGSLPQTGSIQHWFLLQELP